MSASTIFRPPVSGCRIIRPRLCKGSLAVLAFLAVSSVAMAQEPLFSQQSLSRGNESAAGDRFGTSVAVSGDGKTLVTGAAQASERGTLSGAVFTFLAEPTGEWPATPSCRPLTADDTTVFDSFGFSVALSDNGLVLAVGAPLQDRPLGNSGAVYVFTRTDATSCDWTLQAKLTPDDAQAEDQFGTSVSLSGSGTFLAAGAPQPNPETRPEGKAYVFQWDGSTWIQSAPLKGDHPFDFFGFSVSISADALVVGAPGADSNGEEEVGAAYVFETADGWSSRVPLSSGAETGDELGVAVAISQDGSTVAVGARQAGRNNAGPGAVSVFERQNGDWKPVGNSFSGGADNGSQFGAAVAIRADGKVLVVGARKAGTVYLLQKGGGSLSVQKTFPFCSQNQVDAEFGRSVALSATGASFAVGAHLADLEGKADAGSVCAFDLRGLSVSIELKQGENNPDDIEIIPGDPVHYEVKVTNHGSSTVDGVTLTITFDATRLTGATLCTDEEDCQTGEGSITVTINNLSGSGGTRAFTFEATVNPTAVGSLGIHAELGGRFRDLTPEDNANDADLKPLSPKADLKIENKVREMAPTPLDKAGKTSPLFVLRGKTLLYTITATNKGPSHVPLAEVTDSFSDKVFASVRWRCGGSGQWTKDFRLEKRSSFSPGAILRCEVEATTKTGDQTPVADIVREVVNTATIGFPPGATSIPDPSPRRDESSSVTVILPVARLRITKRTKEPVAVPGSSVPVIYTLTITNFGPDDASAKVTDLFPPELSGVAWECKATGNASCASEDEGNIFAIPIRVGPARASLVAGVVTFTAQATVGPSVIGTIKNTATVKLDPEYADTNLSDNVSVHSLPLTPRSDLAVVIEHPPTAIPGSPFPFEFRVIVSNDGLSDVRKATVRSRFSSDLTHVSWTCAALEGSCGESEGEGDIFDDHVSLRVNGKLTYTVTALVSAGAFPDLENEASVNLPAATGETDPRDPRLSNNDVTKVLTLTPVTDLAIGQHTGPVVSPDRTLRYTFEVTNAGPSDARSVGIRHIVASPVEVLSWTCTALLGSCAPSGTGQVRDTASLRVGGRLVYEVTAFYAGFGVPPESFSARARVTPPQEGTDPRLDNNVMGVAAVADLAITQRRGDDKIEIIVTNAGPSDITGAIVTLALDGLSLKSWSCSAIRGSCTVGLVMPPIDGTSASGFADTVSLRVGGTLTYTLTVETSGDNVEWSSTAEVGIPAERGTDPRCSNNKSVLDTGVETRSCPPPANP